MYDVCMYVCMYLFIFIIFLCPNIVTMTSDSEMSFRMLCFHFRKARKIIERTFLGILFNDELGIFVINPKMQTIQWSKKKNLTGQKGCLRKIQI